MKYEGKIFKLSQGLSLWNKYFIMIIQYLNQILDHINTLTKYILLVEKVGFVLLKIANSPLNIFGFRDSIIQGWEVD